MMLKLLLCSCLMISVIYADISNIQDSWDSQNYLNNVIGSHNSQHQQSVDAAREELRQKLASIGGKNSYVYGSSQGNSYGSSGSERYSSSINPACSYCDQSTYNSRQASSQQLRNSDYSGVGTVGHLDSRLHDDDSEDVQLIVKPTLHNSGSSRYSSASSSRSSSNRFSSDGNVQQVVDPGYSSRARLAQDNDQEHLSSVTASQYRKVSEQDEEDLQRTVTNDYRPVHAGSSRTFSSHSSDASRVVSTGGAPIYGGSVRTIGSTNRNSEDESTNRISAVVRPGQPIRVSYVPGQGVISTSQLDSSASSSQTNSQSTLPNSSTYRIVYTPKNNYHSQSSQNSESERTTSTRINGVQQPEKLTNYETFYGSSRVREDESDDTQQRVAPVTFSNTNSNSQPINGGNSRYSSSSNSQYNSASTRFGDSRPSSDRSRNTGTSHYYNPSTSTSSQSSQSQTQGQQQTVSGYFSPYAPVQKTLQQQQIDSASSSSRQGSSTSRTQYQPTINFDNRFSGGISDHSDLRTFMTEAERMAEAQQRQVASNSNSGSRYGYTNSELNRRTFDTAANLDAAAAKFVGSSANRNSEFDLVDSNNANANDGGYQKVRSWSRQSKWAAGSEYGPDGKPTTYSRVSTGEAEKFNINGKEAGYNAATSTVEKDGKVSTYSMHS